MSVLYLLAVRLNVNELQGNNTNCVHHYLMHQHETLTQQNWTIK